MSSAFEVHAVIFVLAIRSSMTDSLAKGTSEPKVEPSAHTFDPHPNSDPDPHVQFQILEQPLAPLSDLITSQ